MSAMGIASKSMSTYLEPNLRGEVEISKRARIRDQDMLTCTLRALNPIDLPTSSRIAVVGNRDCERIISARCRSSNGAGDVPARATRAAPRTDVAW